MPLRGLAPKRKRKRTYNWSAIFLAVLIPVVVAGIVFSPITSLSRVRVVGSRDEDRAVLADAVKTLRDQPFFRANGRNVEALATNIPEIESASLSRNIFGRGVLTVRYREPVARVFGAADLAIDDQGSIFRCRNVDPTLPAVQFVDGLPEPNGALSATWPALAVAHLAQQVRVDPTLKGLPEQRIGVFNSGSLCLNIGAARVDFGSHYDLDRKFNALIGLLQDDPTLLNRSRSLNLVNPDRPTMLPIATESRP